MDLKTLRMIVSRSSFGTTTTTNLYIAILYFNNTNLTYCSLHEVNTTRQLLTMGNRTMTTNLSIASL